MMTWRSGFLQRGDPRLAAVVASCLISLVTIADNPIPNDDAFSYLRAAELFRTQGLEAMLSAYGWYGYSVLIALVNGIFPIGLINSAHLLNMLAFALLTVTFISLVAEYRDEPRVKLFAALVILLFPTINELRFNLIRDFGYWAFCLAALLQLIRFGKSGRPLHAAGWLLAMAGAVFFRLEGLVILALSPFALLVPWSLPHRGRRLLVLGGLLLAGTATILLLFFLAGINLIEVFRFAYRWYLPLLAAYPDTLASAASGASLSEHISPQLAMFAGKGLIVLLAGYLYAVAATLVMTLGPPVALFLVYTWLTGRQRLDEAAKWPWLFFTGASLLSLLLFVSIMQFLTTRYAVMTALLLLTLMPLALDNLYLAAQASGRLQTCRRMAGFWLVYFVVDSLVSFGYSKAYIEEAIAWSRDNMAPGSTLQTNNFAVAYYSGLVAAYDEVDIDPAASLAALGGSGYLVLELSHDELALREQLAGRDDLAELAAFANTRGDAIIIYRLSSSE